MPDTQTAPAERVLLTWKAPIKAHAERTKRWYVIAGVIVLAIAAYAIITGAWSVALVSVLCGGMYVMVHDHRLPDANVTVTENGISVNDKTLAWKEVKGYWLVFTPDYIELHVAPSNRKPELIVQTGNQDITALKQAMAEFTQELPEKKEYLVDTFIRLLKL